MFKGWNSLAGYAHAGPGLMEKPPRRASEGAGGLSLPNKASPAKPADLLFDDFQIDAELDFVANHGGGKL